MRSSIETKAKSKYDKYFSQIIMLQNFVIFLTNASFYTQKGYDNFYIPYIFIAAFIMSAGYIIYRISRDYRFSQFFINRYRAYTKTSSSRLMGVLCLGFLIMRFLLSPRMVFFFQNAFFIVAFVFLAAAILRLTLNRRCNK